ncbi:hypothetical protein D3C80_2167030 [compost metagenome]
MLATTIPQAMENNSATLREINDMGTDSDALSPPCTFSVFLSVRSAIIAFDSLTDSPKDNAS